MRLGRLGVAAICGALVAAAPAAAEPQDHDLKVKQCKREQHKRFACERTDGVTLTTFCPDGYDALSYTTAPDADLNGNLVICYAKGLTADDTP